MTDAELLRWAADTRKESDEAYYRDKVGPFGPQAAARWRTT